MAKLKRYDPTKWFFNQLLFCVGIIAFICVMVLIFGCEKAETTELNTEISDTTTTPDRFIPAGWTCEERLDL